MTQNNTNADKNQAAAQSLVKSDKSSNSLTVKGKGSLLALTDSIISSAITARKANQLAVDDSWMQEIWDWADKFGVDEKDVPRKRENLLELTSLKLIGSVKRFFSRSNGFTSHYNDKFSELPESIGNLTNLTSLNLSANELSELPESIGNLTNLTSLELCDNSLSELPESIGNLTNLTSLNLNENSLSELPESIGNLTNLTWLELCDNSLSELPKSIGNLTNLTSLDVESNELNELPDSIGQLTNLTSLELGGNE